MEIVNVQTAPTSVLGEIYLENTLLPEEQALSVLPQEMEMPDLLPSKGFMFAAEGKFYVLQELKSSFLPLVPKEFFFLSECAGSVEKLKTFLSKESEKPKFEKKIYLETKESKNTPFDVNLTREKSALKSFEKVDRVIPKAIRPKEAQPRVTTNPPIKEKSETQKKEERSEKEKSIRTKEKEQQCIERRVERENRREFRDERERRERQSQSKEEEQEEEKRECRDANKRQDKESREDDNKQKRQEEPHCGDERHAKEELGHYFAQESSLGDLLGVRVTHFDIMLLFFEILKLALKAREQEKLTRLEERELELAYLQKTIEDIRKQARYILLGGLGAGALGIASGMLPIIGHMKGEWIIDKVRNVPLLNSLSGMSTKRAFDGLRKMTESMGDMYKSTGEVQKTFAEGHRTQDQHLSELHKSDGDESSRTIEEIKDYWKNVENFLFETLRMEHETVRQLYN